MKPLFEATNTIIEGTEDYPVWINFSKIDGKEYVNSEAEAVTCPYECFFIVNNGSVRVAWDNHFVTVEAGQGAMIKKNVATKIQLASTESASFYSLLFDEKFILSDGKLFEEYGKAILDNSDVKVVELTDKQLQGEMILEGLNRIIAVNLTHKNGCELITKGILCYIWLYLVEYVEGVLNGGADNSAESRDDRRVKAACEYIAKHYGDIVTLGDIATHISLSEGECCRAFERVIFMSPIEYLMKYRIYSAVKILLRKSSEVDSISELSFVTGFNSPSYFNRVFKKYIQCSPGEYKKMIKSDSEQAEKIYTSIQEEITLL